MDTATVADRIARQRAEDLRRLADQGERNGVRVLDDPRANVTVATSATDPTRVYVVTTRGCTCKGFATWGRCQHFALFLAFRGELPGAEPETAPCLACNGTGREPDCRGHATPGGRVVCECSSCDGAGAHPVGDVYEEVVAELVGARSLRPAA